MSEGREYLFHHAFDIMPRLPHDAGDASTTSWGPRWVGGDMDRY
jgi:hypothetical protein